MPKYHWPIFPNSDLRRVLVTGATGFVGMRLCDALARAGIPVRAVRGPRRHPTRMPGIEWTSVDSIDGSTNWATALKDVSHIVHLAAIAHRTEFPGPCDEAGYDRVNHLGTARLAEAALAADTVQRLVFVSSVGAVASACNLPINETTPPAPDTAYGRSKLAGELAVRRLLANSRLEWTILRPPLVYGPENPGNMARLLKLVRSSAPLPFGSVRACRSYLFVDNLIDAIRVALSHPAAARRVFCLADGPPLPLRELLVRLGRHYGRVNQIIAFPPLVLRGLGEIGEVLQRVGVPTSINRSVIDKLCSSLVIDDHSFRYDCSWVPPFTLDEGLACTVNMPSTQP